MRRTGALAAFALVLGLAAGQAYAQTTIGVLGIEPQDAPESLARELTQALRQRAAGASGFATVAGKDLVEIKLVFGCVDEAPACMAHAGKSLGAQKLLFGSLRKVPGGFKVSLKWLDVATMHLDNVVTEPVPAENATTAGIRGLAVRWFATLSGTKVGGALQVTTNLSGVKVFIDDHLAGTASVDKPVAIAQLAPGPHEVRAEKPGFRPFSQRVRVVSGEAAQVSARLEEEPSRASTTAAARVPSNAIPNGHEQPPDTGERPGRGWRWAFWGTAAAAVGTGIGWLVAWNDRQGVEKDKEAAVQRALDDKMGQVATHCAAQGCPDVCPYARSNPGGDPTLAALCDAGERDSRLQWVLGGAFVASVLLSGTFFYFGYLETGGATSNAAASSSSSSRLRVGPQLYGAGSGVGVIAEFEF